MVLMYAGTLPIIVIQITGGVFVVILNSLYLLFI